MPASPPGVDLTRLPRRGVVALFATLLLTALWIAQGQAAGEAIFPMPDDPRYRAECGSCHTSYAPGLLPARSWKKMMAELDNHFGDDASLDTATREALTRELIRLAADSPGANVLMRRIASGFPPQATPQRISDSPFFRYMHDEVPERIWKRPSIGNRANCGACHRRAEEGRYLEREVRIPRE